MDCHKAWFSMNIVISNLLTFALMKSLLLLSIVLVSLLFILLVCSMNSVYFTMHNEVADVIPTKFLNG